MSNYSEQFSERLSELMFERKINATELGGALECGEACISRYCTGAAMPAFETLIKLADFFSVTCDFLLGLKNESNETAFLPIPPFADRFAYLCKKHGISRYKLRQKTDIAESVMRYWIQGKTTPSVLNLIRLAEKGFECSVDYLVGREK